MKDRVKNIYLMVKVLYFKLIFAKLESAYLSNKIKEKNFKLTITLIIFKVDRTWL